ncbi:MAG: tRNA uridine-5-carboxymethylaminomethyl(34) synthesis GTPase MnmE [Vicinamibacterales bacterium]
MATPDGRGAIGVVRLSGGDAVRVVLDLTGRAAPLEPRHATFCRLAVPGDGTRPSVCDQVVVTTFPAPHSYTGEDVVEISTHGNPLILRAVVGAAMAAGARLAEPGEFTLRAFLHGKLDLVQAEAVRDLVAAVTPLQARVAFDQLEGTLTGVIGSIERELFELTARLEASLDFPEEGYHFVAPGEAADAIGRVAARIDGLLAGAARGRLIREGASVTIVGPTNAGKSSLFNALLQASRAIVTEVPGTTRDLLTERAEIGGLVVSLVDTAGVRESGDAVEQEGMRRARGAAAVADVVLVVVDRSRALTMEALRVLEDTAALRRVVVANKSDLPAAWDADVDALGGALAVATSAVTGEGLDVLAAAIVGALGGGEPTRDRPALTNLRHARLLEQARESLSHAAEALATDAELPEEFLLADLQDAASRLQEVSGRRTPEDLLRHIFESFCIGK